MPPIPQRHSRDTPSSALVPFRRWPLLRFAPTTRAAEHTAFDPHLALCLPPETLEKLGTILLGSGPSVEAALAARAAAIRDAYHELAAVYHPDAAHSGGPAGSGNSGSSGCARPPVWLADEAMFSVISAAYRVLSDPRATVEYLIAAGAAGGAALSRELRRRFALEEVASMGQAIDAAVAAQVSRQHASGDGLFIELALFGDQRAITAAASSHHKHNAGVPPSALVTDVTRVLSGHVEVVAAPGGGGATCVQLVLPTGSKKGLEGFWDPCDGEWE